MGNRQTMLARIHILRKELGLSDLDYRHILLRGWGETSAALLTDDSLAQAIATFKGMQTDNQKTFAGIEKNFKRSSKKIWAEWYKLKQQLPLHKRSANYLLGIAQRNAPRLGMKTGILDFDTCSNMESINILKSLIQANKHARR